MQGIVAGSQSRRLGSRADESEFDADGTPNYRAQYPSHCGAEFLLQPISSISIGHTQYERVGRVEALQLEVPHPCVTDGPWQFHPQLAYSSLPSLPGRHAALVHHPARTRFTILRLFLLHIVGSIPEIITVRVY